MTLPVDASAASTAEADANAGMRDDNKRLAARRAAQFTVALIREAWPYSPKKLWRYRAWWLAAALIVMAALAAAYFWYVPILELRKAQNEYDHDNRDGARKLLEANPQRWSNNAAAQFLLGVIAARDGESLRALEYYEKAARLDSSAPQYKGNLAATRLRIDDSATARKDAQRVFSEILDGNQPFLLAAAEWLRLELVRDGGPDWKAIEARMATGNRWLDETAMNQPWNLHYWRFPDGSGELQRLYYNGDRQQPRDDRQCYWFGLQQLAKYLRDSSMPLFWPPACTESEPARAVLAADILRIYKAHPQWQTRLRAAAAGLELPTGPDI